MEMKLTKGARGWVALSTMLLPGIPNKDNLGKSCPAQLQIETSKRLRGGCESRATVVFLTGTGFTHAISFIPGEGDYSRGVTSDPKARVTEGKVKAMHETATAPDIMAIVLADIGKHYGVEDPAKAPEAVPA